MRVLLSRAQAGENVVFVEERQNLYVDDLQELEMWAELLKNVNFSQSSQQYLLNLEDWVTEGFHHLCEGLRNRFDGPLGISFKWEVLVVYLRVIMMADVLLFWAAHRGHTLTYGKTRILDDLAALGHVGKLSLMHHRILRRIGDVLRRYRGAGVPNLDERTSTEELAIPGAAEEDVEEMQRIYDARTKLMRAEDLMA